jgi:hypothetical protein
VTSGELLPLCTTIEEISPATPTGGQLVIKNAKLCVMCGDELEAEPPLHLAAKTDPKPV